MEWLRGKSPRLRARTVTAGYANKARPSRAPHAPHQPLVRCAPSLPNHTCSHLPHAQTRSRLPTRPRPSLPPCPCTHLPHLHVVLEVLLQLEIQRAGVVADAALVNNLGVEARGKRGRTAGTGGGVGTWTPVQGERVCTDSVPRLRQGHEFPSQRMRPPWAA